MLQAIDERQHLLSTDEKARNSHALAQAYSYSKSQTGRVKSPYPAVFPEVKSHVKKRDLSFPHAAQDDPPLRYLANFDRERYYPGFPTFRFLKHTFAREFVQVKVFNFPSKNESIVVDVSPSTPPPSARDIALKQKYLGAHVWVRWPHLVVLRRLLSWGLGSSSPHPLH